jgi:hypothetical protein
VARARPHRSFLHAAGAACVRDDGSLTPAKSPSTWCAEDTQMNARVAAAGGESRYELRFAGLFERGRGYSFPCDSQGRVDMDAMSERSRTNYLFARAVVGNVLCAPVVLSVP